MTPPFDGLRSPRPAPELRDRVLRAAAEAVRPQPHWIDLLWESRRVRLAFALALFFALVLNLPFASNLGAPRPAPRTVEVEGFTVLAERFERPPADLPEEFR